MNAFAAIGPAARTAVFVDGENLSACHAPALRAMAERHGRADLRRVYGDVARIGGWRIAPGFEPVHSGTGKNAADILLCLDALEAGLGGGFATILLASSDGDFTHPAQRLRARGLRVVGMGEDKAPERFRAACTEFESLGVGPAAVQRVETERSEVGAANLARVQAIVAGRSDSTSGVLLSDLNGAMWNGHAFKVSTTPEKTWRAWLLARPVHFDVDPKGSAARVRLRGTGTAPA